MKPNQRATVYTLLERGSTQREIARITGIDRKTVRSYQRRWEAELASSPAVATGSEAVAVQIPPPSASGLVLIRFMVTPVFETQSLLTEGG